MSIDTNANKRPRTHSSFREQLERQLKYLYRSCELYDKGEHDEAIRIAVTLRVLLHDTTKSTSLLRHLGIKESLDYLDTGIYVSKLEAARKAWGNPGQPGWKIVGYMLSDAGFVIMRPLPNGTYGWFPSFNQPRYQPHHWQYAAMSQTNQFKYWWSEPVVETSYLKAFSRKNLVSIMANQDGGAHVDAGLDSDYYALCLDNLGHRAEFTTDPARQFDSLEDMVKKIKSGEAEDIAIVANNVAYASVRQIAHEVILTLQDWQTKNP